jgi:hypothetical protein
MTMGGILESLPERLLDHWRKTGASPASPCAEKAIQEFEHRESVELPEDLRRIFLAANGMNLRFGLGKDNDGFSFWPLDHLVRADVELLRRSPTSVQPTDPSDFYVFADYMDWSWAYAVKLRGGRVGTVVLLGGLGPVNEVASSLAEFVERYMSGASLLYPRQ